MFVFVAVMIAGVGYAEIDDNRVLERRGEVVAAIVVHEETGRSPLIEVRFVTRDGRTVETTTENYQEAEVGKTIQLIYDPLDPTRLQSTDWGYDNRTPAIAFGGGALAALIVALSRFWSRPDEPPTA
ncbi:hypothetical protein EV652_103654 [Kribbella steppae]|uniref:DUF3592 domain-containing protein n=1 Tax=Kribbella steppae TaxID=2512223 RepID=A0A4R2HR37_9ACTN|nr:DUF3592 domain-containing protein [Kribbella steppae]TCO33652.1 hypothetical protein EV652_103654 [Kribbella steppae]